MGPLERFGFIIATAIGRGLLLLGGQELGESGEGEERLLWWWRWRGLWWRGQLPLSAMLRILGADLP